MSLQSPAVISVKSTYRSSSPVKLGMFWDIITNIFKLGNIVCEDHLTKLLKFLINEMWARGGEAQMKVPLFGLLLICYNILIFYNVYKSYEKIKCKK